MHTILLLGSEGYIGHALKLRLLNKGYRVICVDNGSREKCVREVGSFSATDIRNRCIDNYYNNYYFYNFSIDKDYELLRNLVRDFQPQTIVNLAQQPSAPYSHKSLKHTTYTTFNNEMGTINCLYAIKESQRDIHLIQIGSMGEYDQSFEVDIEEGIFDFKHNGRTAKNVIYPRRAPSFYHSSKIASTYYIDLAVRCWDISVTDIMQGVVYGNWTPEIEETGMQTRLDSDECFGTCVNRFIVQALMEYPLTVFGEGLHTRGFLALNDSVQCLMLAVENRPERGQYRTWNQLDKPFKIIEIAEQVKNVLENVEIKYIPTPRVERTDDFYYNAKVDKIRELGFQPTRNMRQEIEYVVDMLKDKDLRELEKVVMPEIFWRE